MKTKVQTITFHGYNDQGYSHRPGHGTQIGKSFGSGTWIPCLNVIIYLMMRQNGFRTDSYKTIGLRFNF